MKDSDVFEIGGPLDLTFLMKMYGMEGFEDCKDEKIYSAAGTGTDERGQYFCQYPQR